MALTHTRTFRVRHYECDGYGHVNNAMYLRYMQEAAIDASTAAGYDLARYQAMGRLWLIHETQIDYLRPLTYGDSVTVKTWVTDFGRVRSRRDYEFTHVGTGELVATAYSDWLFVDTVTRRPAAIPADLIAAFSPGGVPPPARKRDSFPAPPPPPPGVFKTRRKVEWRDVDAAGHVNNASYIAFVGEAGFALGEAFGWPHARMWAEGFGILARQHRIEYRQEAVYGDELEIATWFSGVRAASATRHYVITRASDAALVARVNTQYVWVDRATLKPRRIPATFLAEFAPNMVA